MITIRKADEIHQTGGRTGRGTHIGRLHFSFEDYYDPEYNNFGTLRVLNDEILSPGAELDTKLSKDSEVITYCADGECRHEGPAGTGGILRKGWVQHTAVKSGLRQAEINNRPDSFMRFVQLWFFPAKASVRSVNEQKRFGKKQRENRFLPLVSEKHPGALRIQSDARVYASALKKGKKLVYLVEKGRGIYVYVLEGGPVRLNGKRLQTFSAASAVKESKIVIESEEDSEILMADVLL